MGARCHCYLRPGLADPSSAVYLPVVLLGQLPPGSGSLPPPRLVLSILQNLQTVQSYRVLLQAHFIVSSIPSSS